MLATRLPTTLYFNDNLEMALKKTNTIPVGSVLENYEVKFDYVDSFSVQLDRDDVQSWEPIAAFLQSSPKWFDYLFKLRNVVVKKLGLKVGMVNLDEINPPFSIGNKFGLFELFEINSTEGILGENDFHLDFRLSFKIDEDNVLHVTTAIVFNNIFGKIYLAVIKPFHRFIVPFTLKIMAKSINEKTVLRRSV